MLEENRDGTQGCKAWALHCLLGLCEWKGILRESGILFLSLSPLFETSSLSRDNPGFPGILSADQAGLEVIDIHLLLPLAKAKGQCHHEAWLPFS